MREIKFRALNKNNEFIYGLPYTDGVNATAYFKEYNNRLCWRRESDGASCNQPYKNGTLSQYTGLKDKNGTEIYEGDIVKCTDGADEINEFNSDTGIGKVEWLTKWGFWNISNIENGLGDILHNGYVEVIGNIFEHKYLLEGEKND